MDFTDSVLDSRQDCEKRYTVAINNAEKINAS